MTMRFATPVAGAATAILLLGACSDDGPTTLARGEDVTFVAGPTGLSGQTMDITAEEEDGEVTGEASFDPYGSLDLQCADTDTDDLLILGGALTETEDADAALGDWVAVVIRVGDPDSVDVWFPEGDHGSCQALLEAAATADHTFTDVAGGDEIETG